MGFLGNEKGTETASAVEGPLYRALAAGDLPGAWLLIRPLLDSGRMDRLSGTAAFNCALCLYRLEEYERALPPLKRAEQSLGSPTGLDASGRKLFIQAITAAPDTALLPLDPEAGADMGRYALIRIRWLTALCLLRLDRKQEAASILRFLAQYQIKI